MENNSIAIREDILLKHFEDTMHDIKTPISIIHLMIQNMENIEDMPEQMKSSLEITKKYCLKIIQLLSDMNDSDKILSGRFRTKLVDYDCVMLAESITQATIALAERKNIFITFDTDIEEKVIAMDKDLFERIMLNILSNSIKFTHDDGMVEVIAKNSEDYFQIDVIDNGIGFEEINEEDIFNRYAIETFKDTENKNGSGIGLSIVKEMIEILSGKIEIKKNPKGAGTCVSLFFSTKLISEHDSNQNNTDSDGEDIIQTALY